MEEQQHTKQPDQYAALPVYQCHKRVRAAKITWIARDGQNIRIELRWGEVKYRVIVDDEWLSKHHAVEGGYFVVYDDGYTSYSPARVFEEGYTPIQRTENAAVSAQLMQAANADIKRITGIKVVLPHQQRVLNEKVSLADNLTSLLAFFQTPLFESLSDAERSRLRNQARFMDGYAAVLEERIAAFEPSA